MLKRVRKRRWRALDAGWGSAVPSKKARNRRRGRGVYPGMFETTLTLSSGRQKPWTVFAGLSGQLLALGAAMLVPLIYTDRLPLFRISDLHIMAPLAKPLSLTPAPPAMADRRPSPRPQFVSPHGLIAPIGIPSKVIEIDDGPLLAAYDGPSIPGAVPDSHPAVAGILSHVAAAPPPPVVKPRPVETAPPPEKTIPRIRIGGDVQAARILHRVLPVYPPLARQARVSGAVQLLGVVGRDGRVAQLQVISGHPLLVRAALDAVQQWTYRPTLLNGEPVEVVAPIEVRFTLAQ